MNVQDVQLLVPKEAPESTVEANLELIEQIKQYQSSCAKAQAFSGECEKLKTEILNYLGFAQKLTHNGKTIATWKCSKASSRVDSKALAQAYPDIAKSFTSQVLGSRRFLLKEAA